MHEHRIGATAHKAQGAKVLIAGLEIALGMAMGAGTATAQTPPASAGSAPSEAVQRQANSPYRFILQNANAPARAKPAPAPAPVEAKKPLPPPEQTAIAKPSPVQAAPAPAAPAPAPVPEPVPVASIPPKQEAVPAVVRRDVIPVRTEDPKLPAALMRERPSGVVRVQFELNPDGSTGNVKVVTSTNRSLNRASVEAVSNWKFQPVDEVLSIETELAYKYD
ncbi:MAG: energy transducer TonB [Pseudomonadota bacterium]